eukprot:gene8991-11051_t
MEVDESDEESSTMEEIHPQSSTALTFSSSAASTAIWKTGVLPYEIIFARVLVGARRTTFTKRDIYRLDNYYPSRPITKKVVEEKLGPIGGLYRVHMPSKLKNLILNNAERDQVLHWISVIARDFLDEIYHSERKHLGL